LSKTQKDRLDTVGIMNRIFEKKKGTILQSIDENMLSPFVPDKA
jgi:ribosomal protein L14E/L6E/L27E